MECNNQHLPEGRLYRIGTWKPAPEERLASLSVLEIKDVLPDAVRCYTYPVWTMNVGLLPARVRCAGAVRRLRVRRLELTQNGPARNVTPKRMSPPAVCGSPPTDGSTSARRCLPVVGRCGGSPWWWP